MIPEVLEKELDNCFRLIKFRKNKDGDLSVNEWEIDVDSSVEMVTHASYADYTFIASAIFEANTINKKFLDNPKFLNELKLKFVVLKINTTRVEENRVKMDATLMQSVSTCNS